MTTTKVEIKKIVTFTDTSGVIDASYTWNFGDGTTSILKNPTHIYTSLSPVGSPYKVDHTVTKIGCATSTCTPQYVEVVPVGQAGSNTGMIVMIAGAAALGLMMMAKKK